MKAQALRSRRSSPIASTSFDAGYIAPGFRPRWPAGGKAALARVEPFF